MLDFFPLQINVVENIHSTGTDDELMDAKIDLSNFAQDLQ